MVFGSLPDLCRNLGERQFLELTDSDVELAQNENSVVRVISQVGF